MSRHFPSARTWFWAFLSILTLAFLTLALLVAGTALLQGATPPGPTDDSVTDDEVNTIAKQLYCPVCENIPLDVCPTQACAQWRALIREKLAAGWTEGQIKDYFVQQYGDRVLATPPAHGLNWVVYLLPPVAIVTGSFLLYRALRAWKTSTAASAAQPDLAQSADDEYAARLEEELRRR